MPATGSPSDRPAAKPAAKRSASQKVQGSKTSSSKKAVKKKPATKKKPVTKKAATKKKPATKKAATKKKAVAKKQAAKAVEKKPAVKKRAATTKKPATKKKAVAKKQAAKKAAKKKTPFRKKAVTKTPTARNSVITKRATRKRPAVRSRPARPLIGWREWVVLPDFTSTPIKAKVDSGAVTSSIHAFNLQLITDGDQTIARFGVAPRQGSHAEKTAVECPVVGFKKVRSSNGQAELRPVVRTHAVIGEKSFEIDITLASRDAMGFRMLLGRKAVRNRFVIDPGRSFLQPATFEDVPETDR